MVTVDPVVKSQMITWVEVGGIEVVVDIIDGDFIDPEAVEIPYILAHQRGFRQFLSAIEKAKKTTSPLEKEV